MPTKTPATDAFLAASKAIASLDLSITQIECALRLQDPELVIGYAKAVQDQQDFTPEQLEWVKEIQGRAARALSAIDKTQSALRQITKATLAIPEAFGSPEVAA